MISIGKKRLRFIAQVPVETPDGANSQTRNFTDVFSVWGALQRQGQTSEQPRLKIILRWNDLIKPGMRLKGQGRTYTIITAQDLTGLRREMSCDVEETVF
jgi:head-tail adaptor